jgi:hypothetical protein
MSFLANGRFFRVLFCEAFYGSHVVLLGKREEWKTGLILRFFLNGCNERGEACYSFFRCFGLSCCHMKPFEQISFPSEEAYLTPVERRLIQLEEERKERASKGKQETIMQRREYELVLRENILLDLEELKKTGQSFKGASGYAKTLDALVAGGFLPKDAWEKHPGLEGEIRTRAMKKLEELRESNEHLLMLEAALCTPSLEYERLDGAVCESAQQTRASELKKLEAEWEVN